MVDTSNVLARVRDLSIGYGGKAIQEHLTFDLLEGEVFVILGGSGCGKSTLLRNLVGLESPIAGSIEYLLPNHFDGAPEFGVSFQSGALFSSMTLKENIALPLQRWTSLSPATVSAVALARLRLVGLGGFENHLPADISGGMKKRAGIARALALDPRLLFLDEPSAGLDPVSAVELDDLLLTLRDQGITTVIVTHELESIFRIATRCIMLDRDARGMIAEGDPSVLRDSSPDPRVRRFFNRMPANAIVPTP